MEEAGKWTGWTGLKNSSRKRGDEGRSGYNIRWSRRYPDAPRCMEWGEGTGGENNEVYRPGQQDEWGANERIQKNKIKHLKIEIK